MEKQDWDNPEEKQDYSLLSLINMFAKVIIFSLESFNDIPMSLAKEIKEELDKWNSPESLAARYNIPVENIRKVFLKWQTKTS